MTYAVVIAALLVLVLAVVGSLSLRARRIGSAIGVGFRDYVRKPRLRAKVANAFAARDAAAAKMAKRPPEKLIPLLLRDDDYILAKRAIMTAGPHVVPFLIRAISQPEFRRRTDTGRQEGLHLLMRRSEPLVTVLECLGAYAPTEAIPAVAALVEDADPEVRKQTALLLGTIGTDAAAKPLAASLADEDDYVRNYAMMGILRAIEANRVTPGFRRPVFDAIRPLVFRHDRTVSGDAPVCLLSLDRERAILELTDAEALTPGREGLQYVLEALRQARVPVDESRLLHLVAELEDKAETYPNDYVIGEALQLLARTDSDAARTAISRGMQSASEHVRESAAEAMAASLGIENPFDRTFERLDSVGWQGLNAAEAHVLAVRVLIDEVNNGGLSQYFVNSSGDQWNVAVEGLKAIGATSDLSVLKTATAMFGPEGPSAETDERHRELARVVASDDQVFAPLETVFYENRDDREVLLMKYIVAHAADFTVAYRQ